MSMLQRAMKAIIFVLGLSASFALGVDVANIVPNSYIVRFKDGTAESTTAEHYSWLQELRNNRDFGPLNAQTVLDDLYKYKGITHKFGFGGAFRGYGIHTDENTVRKISEHPDIDSIEPNHYVRASPILSHAPVRPFDEQKNSPWGLGRISHHGPEDTSWPYLFSRAGLGRGVDVYVMDTGVLSTHPEFGGRIARGVSCVAGEPSTTDYHGHGTHIAGTVAGERLGVAKQATIVPVKVMNSSNKGGELDIVIGMSWVNRRHSERVRKKSTAFKGSVIVLCNGVEGKSNNLELAVNSAIENGIHIVVPAGNEKVDACTTSPAMLGNVMTVGAVAKNDTIAAFSNFGTCVDINAPGVGILSATIGRPWKMEEKNGTSMAAPHVAGVMASLMSRRPTRRDGTTDFVSPAEMKRFLARISTQGLIKDPPIDTKNEIVYSGGNARDPWKTL